jgi:hypothetical protein
MPALRRQREEVWARNIVQWRRDDGLLVEAEQLFLCRRGFYDYSCS